MAASRHLFLACVVVVVLVAPVAAFSTSAIRVPAANPALASSDARSPSLSSVSGTGTISIASTVPAPTVSAASPEVLAGWEGLGGSASGLAPPDPILSAGPSQVVEMVNLQMAVYSKQGASVNVTDLATLFHTGMDFISDPKVQYDPASGRWFATVTDVTTTQVPLAVSTSPDAAAAWRVYSVPGATTGNCLDQPILGVGPSTVIISVNVFTQTSPNTCVTPYLGAEYWVVNKTDLVTGAASPRLHDSGINVLEGSIHPAQMEGPSAVHYMVSTYWPGTATTSNTLHLFAVSGVPPAPVSVSVTSLSMPTAALPPSASQRGTRSTLDTGDIRISDADWSSGELWLGFDEACLSDSTRACVRLVQIDTTASTVLQDFDFDIAGKDVFYPAFRVDGSGSLAVVFGYSSATDYPGIMTTGRLPGDPLNTYQAPQVVVAGTGAETSACSKNLCRYGDYFGAGRDPANASTVWLVGERGTGGLWSTHVFSVSVKAQLTLAYQVIGGGSGYSDPILSYVHDGAAAQTAFGTSPSTVLADPSTPWSVSTVLPGSSTTSGEVWPVNGTAGAPASSGLASTSVAQTFTYFHEYRATLDFTVLGGSGFTASPSVNATVFGAAVRLSVPGTYDLDAGTEYAFPQLLNGSASSERWVGSSAVDGLVSSVLNLSVAYYHQVLVTFDYAILGTTAAVPPQVEYASLGVTRAATANATVWADSQSAYAYEDTLSSPSQGVRWGSGTNGNGTITVPQTFSVLYREQFYLSVTADPANLSAYATPSGWYDAGSAVALSASAPSGWRFSGWTGDASGSTPSLSLQMVRPMNVTAAFDAGLTLVAGAGGSVAYAYGSVSGTVAAGTSVTLYVPVGTAVTLTAEPSSWTQAFTGWSGVAGGASGTATVTVNGPSTAAAGFGLYALGLAGLSLLILVVAVALVAFVILRRRRKQPPRGV